MPLGDKVGGSWAGSSFISGTLTREFLLTPTSLLQPSEKLTDFGPVSDLLNPVECQGARALTPSFGASFLTMCDLKTFSRYPGLTQG